MTKERAIEILEYMNDGYTFKDCAICDRNSYNEKTNCCDRNKCEYLKAIDVVLDIINKTNNKEDNLKNYEIDRIGNLSLCYETFINRKHKNDEIEICMWDKDFQSRWTIASFDKDEEYDCYRLNSCLDRLNEEKLNWQDFGELVKKGYKFLGAKGVYTYSQIYEH